MDCEVCDKTKRICSSSAKYQWNQFEGVLNHLIPAGLQRDLLRRAALELMPCRFELREPGASDYPGNRESQQEYFGKGGSSARSGDDPAWAHQLEAAEGRGWRRWESGQR